MFESCATKICQGLIWKRLHLIDNAINKSLTIINTLFVCIILMSDKCFFGSVFKMTSATTQRLWGVDETQGLHDGTWIFQID